MLFNQDTLWQSAQTHARRAFRAYVEGDLVTLYKDSCTAVEHACKAYLVSYHPTLIVGSARGGLDFDTLLWVLGFGHHSKQPATRIASISCREALRRCELLVPALTSLRDGVSRVVDHRNALEHLAFLGETTAVERDIEVVARLLNELLEAAVRDAAEFWGDLREAVDGRLSEGASDELQRVTELVAVARARFAERFPPGSDATLQALRAVVESRADDDGITARAERCPACQQTAYVEGSIGTSGSPDHIVEGPEMYLDFSTVDVEFYPDQLTCPVCDLRLRGSELQAAELPLRVLLENVDATDYYDEVDEVWDYEDD
jgi:hypothetical protein